MNYNSDEAGALQTAEAIQKAGGKSGLFRADLAKEDEVTAMFERIIEIFGRIDICVPNSGIQLKARIDEMTLAQWQRVIDVNLTGMFLCARVRRFVRSKDRGSTGRFLMQPASSYS